MWAVVLLLCVVVLLMTGRNVGVISAGEADSAATRIAQDSSATPAGIRGQVTDDRTGRPLAAVSVGISQAGSLTRVTTDVLGRYEIHGLKPGEYYVIAEADHYVSAVYGQRSWSETGIGVQLRAGEMAAGIDVRLQPAATVNGRVFGVSGDGLTGVEIEVLAERYGAGGRTRVPVAFAQTQQAGVFQVSQLAAGEYYIRAYTPKRSQPSQRSGAEAYASTYFPRTTNLDDAQPIVLNAGQHLFGIDVTLATVRTFSVAGRLIDKTVDSFDRARIFMEARNGAPTMRDTVGVSSDGRFRIPGVSPGEYVLRVIAPGGIRWLTAARQITVADDDVSGVELVARSGARLEGRILRTGLRRLPFDPRTLQMEIVARVESAHGMVGSLIGAGPSTLQPDGTFAFDNVGGPVALRMSELPAGWAVSAVRLDGVDITDNVTDFGEGVRRGIEILLTDQRSELIGRVADRNGRGVSNYTVVVFPEDRDRWRWPSRFVRAARPGHDGAYRIEGLPAANYMAIALDSIPQNAWSNADVLERLWSLATPLRISDGEQRVFDLRLSSYPDLN
jgi:hypothetical protein